MLQKKLKKELSASQEANSRLEETVAQLESRALHLQDRMEQQRLAPTGSGIVHTYSYLGLQIYFRSLQTGNTLLCCTHHLMSRMPRKNGMQCLPFAQSLWLS